MRAEGGTARGHRTLRYTVLSTLTAVLLFIAACSGSAGKPSATSSSATSSGTTSKRPVSTAPTAPGTSGSSSQIPGDIHDIKHIIVIMQENRSFDSYFGTFPGADGIPMSNGRPTVCIPAGAGHPCVRPYVDHADVNGGGPHGATNATGDIDGGKMDGFIEQLNTAKHGCKDPNDPACTNSNTPDVLGYHV